MNKKTIYSVVDLEATGTDAAAGDRIIQFSCTFVQNQKIIDSFSTLINPFQIIPERITQLTGITNQMAQQAPSFRDVASLLYHMLQNTVFVAHNVNFDFPFLNHELRVIGYPILKIKAIDTVTMSQILLPTLPSYQLRRISSYFNIIHKHPHSASSDAYATAYLLILLIDRLRRLPYVTLRGILDINPKLPQNTNEMFRDALTQAKNSHRPLPSYLRIKRGLVLRKLFRHHHFKNHSKITKRFSYPASKQQKLNLFDGQLNWRPAQASMMNKIYSNYNNKNKAKNGLFEVASGFGRKIAYTLPLAYLSHKYHQRVIISAASLSLRKQLADQTIPTLNALLPFNVSKLTIKDNAKYIDLNRYFNTLKVREKSNQTQLVKAMVLVWLTITRTGDLDELHINPRIPYLKEIRHYQNQAHRRHNPFYKQDFIRRIQVAAHRSNFIIVSQKYLYQHANELSHLSKQPYLVIDEADRLKLVAVHNYRYNFNLNLINIAIRRIMGDIYRTHGQNLYKILPNRFKIHQRLKVLSKQISQVNLIYKKITHQFSITFLQKRLLRPIGKHLYSKINLKRFRKYIGYENRNFQIINHDINIITKITRYFQLLSGKRNYRRINRLEMDNFYHHVDTLDKARKIFNSIINLVQAHPENCVFQTVTNEPHNVGCCHIRGGLIRTGNHLRTDVYQYFRPIIFTDHNLIVNPRKSASSQLNLPYHSTFQRSYLKPITKLHPEINFYQNKKLFNNLDEYCQKLINFLLKKARHNQQRILIGFSSRHLMTKMFNILTTIDSIDEPIYALGINGSKNRILKQLTNAQEAIVFTNLDWFNEVNLVHPKLFGSLIIADLPLGGEGNMYQRALIKQAKQSHQNVIKAIQIPLIILILKRSLNYLRYHNSQLTVFDGRLLGTKYINAVRKAMPEGVIINVRKVEN